MSATDLLTADLLIEIGTEDLPAKNLSLLANTLAERLAAALQSVQLTYQAVHYYATPRRLAVHFQQVPKQQPERILTKRGPLLTAAYDAAGQATPAALGFARSCGVAITDLQQEQGYLSYRYQELGKATVKLLPDLLATVLTQLPMGRTMRWGEDEIQFLRPIQWLVLLYGEQAVVAEVLGVTSSAESRGHRFHHPQAIVIQRPDSYVEQLRQANVMVNFAERRETIKTQADYLAQTIGGVIEWDDNLLAEVTGLVEWPEPLLCHFQASFLKVPAECLVASMQQHQKCFPIYDQQRQLLPHFITVSNIISRRPEKVVQGNERVMHARLSDAAFFYEQDSKQSLHSRQQDLEKIIFWNGLGNLKDKSERLTQLTKWLAEQSITENWQAQFKAEANDGLLKSNNQLKNDPDKAENNSNATPDDNIDLLKIVSRAAQLSKCDLATAMVGEFPELQGIMGYYYALQDQEAAATALAIKEHYLPRYANDELPTSLAGSFLAIADRVDNLIGIFGINQLPTGDKDPFGLRRAAIGIIRIIIEQNLPIDLLALLQYAAQLYQQMGLIKNANTVAQVHTFILERLRHWYAEKDISSDVITAVLAVQNQLLVDIEQRILAVKQFRQLPAAAALSQANKRVNNILQKNATALPTAVTAIQSDLLTESAEQALYQVMLTLPAPAKHDTKKITTVIYLQRLQQLAELQAPLERFFNEVMVMVDDLAIRQNRLLLLRELSELLRSTADIALLN